MKNKFFETFTRNASPSDIDKISKNLDSMKRGPIKDIWDRVLQLWEVIKDPNVHWSKKLLPIGALVYLISPVDLILDILPIVGLTDDVAVILYTIKQVSDLIDQQRAKFMQDSVNMVEIQTQAHLKRMRISIIASIVVAILAIIVVIVIRTINAS